MKPSPWLPLLCAAACANGPSSRPSADRNQAAQQQGGLGIPVQYEKLSNGLKVVLSPDHTSSASITASASASSRATGRASPTSSST